MRARATRIPRGNAMTSAESDSNIVSTMPPNGPCGYCPISSSVQLSRRISNMSLHSRNAVVHRDFGAAQHDDEGEAEIHRRGDEIRLEREEGFVLDLPGDIGEFRRADRHRETR